MTETEGQTGRWWQTRRHADRRPALLLRGRIKSAVRAWFEAEGFIEVETACLQVSPGNETHLHAFATAYETEAGARTPFFLHTSPEFACKKLLAAGERRIFTFAPCFRNGEAGRLHAPEFTMLEWYRADQPYDVLMEDCATLLRIAAEVTGRSTWTYAGREALIGVPLTRTSLDQAFARHAGMTLPAAFDGLTPDLPSMRRLTEAIGVRVGADDTWSDLFSRVLAERIEPRLGAPASEILMEYPTHEAALARPTRHDARVAERFELYVCGVELANAFGELTDPIEQRRRFIADMDEKERIYGRRYPIDEDFLAALRDMPAASGAALGFDRLVMLATGAPSVAHVQWTPVM